MRLPKRSLASAALLTLAVAMSGIVSADQWTSKLTPTSAQAEDYNSALGIFVTTSQAVVNPAGCADTDGYVATDSVITNQTLAMALTALASGASVQIYVSSSQCAQSRPMILEFQIN